MGAKGPETSCKTIHSERLLQAYHIRDRPVRLADSRLWARPREEDPLSHGVADTTINNYLIIIFQLMSTAYMG